MPKSVVTYPVRRGGGSRPLFEQARARIDRDGTVTVDLILKFWEGWPAESFSTHFQAREWPAGPSEGWARREFLATRFPDYASENGYRFCRTREYAEKAIADLLATHHFA